MHRSSTLAIGDRAPEFRLSAANLPETVALADLLTHAPVIVEFLRGTWWPNCVKRMAQFEPVKPQIEATGSLVFIAAEKRGGLFRPEKFLAEHPISFPFLLDEDRAVTKAYGVYHRLGVDAVNIARPATFVIDRTGAVRWIYVGKDQHDRAPLEQVLKALHDGGPQS